MPKSGAQMSTDRNQMTRRAPAVDTDHAARRAASDRVETRTAELRVLTPQQRVDLYERLRAERPKGMKPPAVVRRGEIRRDLTLLEALGREAREQRCSGRGTR
jgi:hypothetical protein